MSEHFPPTSGLTPHLTIREGHASEAIDFYAAAFGAEEKERQIAQDGKRLMHAHLLVNGASLLLTDDCPEWSGGVSVPAAVTLHLEVDDADSWFERAVSAGATVRVPLDNSFWGQRYGQVVDRFGHTWSIGGPIKA
jgi:PhnB protein